MKRLAYVEHRALVTFNTLYHMRTHSIRITESQGITATTKKSYEVMTYLEILKQF